MSAPGILRRTWADRPARAGLIVLAVTAALAAAAPVLCRLLHLPAPNVESTQLLDAFGDATGPSAAHPLGIDPLGRDVLSRLLYGGRASLMVALGATALSVTVGMVVGAVAGWCGGAVDAGLSRATEVALCFPFLLLALGLASACSTPSGCVAGTVRPGVSLVTLVIGLTGWPYLARVVRAEVRSLRHREFVLSAQLCGVPAGGVLRRDVLPHLAAPVAVFAAFALPGTLLVESALAYLGVGIPQSTASWGNMLADSSDTFTTAWWYFLSPTVAIAVTALAFNVVAEGVRRASLSAS